ncbi:hypothetical protein K2173_011413 [Erythroxylum novogranatense]|uniref:Probable purine permease n=1 Tax=Erythroxylum novogranatense TaxID=1862640 RepID=A0AAV8S7K1_9ROSI|nr:hypothetical protein K2173_011413 [Erythroxylum novogranatense]
MKVTEKAPKVINPAMKRVLLTLSCIFLVVGGCGGPLIMRLYYIHGGASIWLTCWLQSVGWPVLLIPLAIGYFYRRSIKHNSCIFYIDLPLFLAGTVLGLIMGVDNYFYSYGFGRLPVSTASLIMSSQLAFVAAFAFLIVKQTSGMLALHSSSDKPKGESSKQYTVGFIMALAAALLYGVTMPLMELTYRKSRQEITYTLVLEIQMVMGLFATGLSTIGMIASNEFKSIAEEARNFGLGETKYYMVIVWTAIVYQLVTLGIMGVVFYGSSMFTGILTSCLLPAVEVLAVVFLHENFQAEKGVSLGLSLWGFVSYFYGEVQENKKARKKNDLSSETEMPEATTSHAATSTPNSTENV